MDTQPASDRAAPRVPSRAQPLFAGYAPEPGTYDELFLPDGSPRPEGTRVVELLNGLGGPEFRRRKRLADQVFMRQGITFAVHSDATGGERIFPFDLIPRPIFPAEWERLERGLEQRIRALNAFLQDVYGEQRILAAGVVPREMVLGSRGYLGALAGVRPPGGVFVQIAGIDLIRRPDGEFVVLEDNLRVPSGVSYVLENRQVMKRVFPRIFGEARVRSVDEYPVRLRECLADTAPDDADEPRVVILTPGPYNSAYFEHSFLARMMGCELVQPQDLFVQDERVFVKTTRGPARVHVIYRRVDDAFLDPEVFRKDSLLGVPGLMRAYAAGNVTLANAPGTGVADDKAVYPFVPEFVRFYLGEEPLLGQVETHVCAHDRERGFVLANLSSLVVKAVDEAGGYGMLMGPQASQREIAGFAERIRANPRGYIAQPRVDLSSCPTWTGRRVEPRRVDLRPYVVTGRSTWVLPGGLTRVALRRGSFVVNSSQGGGSKDTWVLTGEGP